MNQKLHTKFPELTQKQQEIYVYLQMNYADYKGIPVEEDGEILYYDDPSSFIKSLLDFESLPRFNDEDFAPALRVFLEEIGK